MRDDNVKININSWKWMNIALFIFIALRSPLLNHIILHHSLFEQRRENRSNENVHSKFWTHVPYTLHTEQTTHIYTQTKAQIGKRMDITCMSKYEIVEIVRLVIGSWQAFRRCVAIFFPANSDYLGNSISFSIFYFYNRQFSVVWTKKIFDSLQSRQKGHRNRDTELNI